MADEPKNEKVVFLAFRNPNLVDQEVQVQACGNCRNKTFTMVHDKPNSFPMLRCACCGLQIGRVGWAQDDAT